MPSLAYLLSLPERFVRALAAGLGGLIYETAEVLLPAWLRRSRLYQVLIYRLLRLTIELVGGVHGVLPPGEVAIKELAVRKAAGNVLELAGFLAAGWSPLWLLAAAADLTGGTRTYLRALVAEFQRSSLLPQEVDITTVEDLLNALENSSGLMADMVDIPPLNVRDLRESWLHMQKNVGSLPDANRLTSIYNQLQQAARLEGRSLGSVSGLIAAGALRAGVQLGSLYIFDYYQAALRAILDEGLPAYARRVSRPYLAAATGHFAPQRTTYTQRLLHRLHRPP